MCTLTHLQTLTLGSSGRLAAWEAQEIHGKTELYSIGARAGVTAIIILLSIPPPVQAIGGHHLACVESSPYTDNSECVLAHWDLLAPLHFSLRPHPIQPTNCLHHCWAGTLTLNFLGQAD